MRFFSDESAEFNVNFKKLTSLNVFSHYHYNCTGALAVESAIKSAMYYKGENYNRVLTFKSSFHGINGYGGIFTDRFGPVNKRLSGFPGLYWEPLPNPIINYKDGNEFYDFELLDQLIDDIENIIKSQDNVCAILVEPIQCTNGDRYFPQDFFLKLRLISEKFDVPLIFDEIQTGFGATGKIWYFENTEIVPDILIFGKKTQLSGIAVQDKFSKIFKSPLRLEVTWDADIIDMIRCNYIMKVFEEESLLENVNNKSEIFLKNLKILIF